MLISFRLQKTVPWLRRLFADVSSLRSSWADPSEIHVVNQVAQRHTFFPSKYFGFPCQYPWYYSLSGEAHDFKKCIKLFSFMLFIYPWNPMATVCTIAFYIKKPYILTTEYSFTLRMTRTKKVFPCIKCVCSVFTARCELDLYIQCKLNSVFKGYRSILTNVISTKHWKSQNAYAVRSSVSVSYTISSFNGRATLKRTTEKCQLK
jgi:hypothetical protein